MEQKLTLCLQTLAAQYHPKARLAVILRGLPGSGKSHWVNALCEALPADGGARLRRAGIFSTDNFFLHQGEYHFDGNKLAMNHQLNLAAFIEALGRGEPLVICDNTNLAHWEFVAYEAAATALGYATARVLVGDPRSRTHQTLCAGRNQHGVSLAAITKMARSFEH